jgi:hypothetical protein
MAHPLTETHLKLCRAEEHLNSVKMAVQWFLQSNPYSLVRQPDPQPPKYSLIANVSQTLSSQLGCIVGDFAHNLRSSLDLLVFEISDLNSQDERKRRGLQFPIFDTPTEYASNENRYLAGVRPAYRAIIDRYQPYQRPQENQRDGLGLLRDLNNFDKHRTIQAVGTVTNFQFFVFDSSSGLPDNVKLSQGAKIRVGQKFDMGNGFSGEKVGDGAITKDGTVVAKLTIPDPEHMNVKTDYTVSIQFTKSHPGSQGRPVMETLVFIFDRVKELVNEFDVLLNK